MRTLVYSILFCAAFAIDAAPSSKKGKQVPQNADGSVPPEFAWAQRKDRLLITLQVMNAADVVSSFDDSGSFKFSAQGYPHDKAPLQKYSLDLEFLKPINSSDSSCTTHARDVQCTIMKKTKERYWKRLLKTNIKPPTMTIDWSKWLDEEKDGVKWNDKADRPWEWWKHENKVEEDDDDE